MMMIIKCVICAKSNTPKRIPEGNFYHEQKEKGQKRPIDDVNDHTGTSDEQQ